MKMDFNKQNVLMVLENRIKESQRFIDNGDIDPIIESEIFNQETAIILSIGIVTIFSSVKPTHLTKAI